jgi:hypothetical protein
MNNLVYFYHCNEALEWRVNTYYRKANYKGRWVVTMLRVNRHEKQSGHFKKSNVFKYFKIRKILSVSSYLIIY